MKNWKDYTKEELQKIANESRAKSDMLRQIGRVAESGGNNTTLNKYLKKHDINIDHFDGQAYWKGQTEKNNKTVAKFTRSNRLKYKEVIGNPTYRSNSVIRNFVLRESLIEYICEDCRNKGVWQGKKLSLDLHHKDGVRENNTLENLCFLCPNCHRQTANFGSKNMMGRKKKTKTKPNVKTKVNSPLCPTCNLEFKGRGVMCRKCSNKNKNKSKINWNEISIIDLLTKHNGNFIQAGNEIGISDNGLRKHFRKQTGCKNWKEFLKTGYGV